MREIWITGATRTPIGAFNGAFARTSAVELGIVAARRSLEMAGLAATQVDETILGNVLQAGQGQNPARQVALGIGVPVSAPAFTVNKVCGSGMKAVDLAWQSLQLQRAEVVLAGGTENMTQAPYLLPAMRGGARLGDAAVVDSVVADGLTDVFNKYHMGITAENVAKQYSLTRDEQDRFALASQQKCAEAMRSGRFADELAAVTTMVRRKELVVNQDEYPRPDCTLDELAKLRAAFTPEGSVTAGNASGINDGAATMLLVAAESAAAAEIDPRLTVRYVAGAAAGCDPATMGLGPIHAVRKLLAGTGLTPDDIDLWELNEAFAAQSLAVLRELRIDAARVNVNGGAIALGHPIGASGARIMVTLIHEMKRREVRRGIAALCIGGGMGMAVLLENATGKR